MISRRGKNINQYSWVLALAPIIAKVGVGGSNPLARSNSISACDDNSLSHKRPKATTRRSRVGFQKLPLRPSPLLPLEAGLDLAG
jgi:hypothetical protein